MSRRTKVSWRAEWARTPWSEVGVIPTYAFDVDRLIGHRIQHCRPSSLGRCLDAGVVGWPGRVAENDQVRSADLLASPNFPISSRSHNFLNIAPIDELFD